MERLQGWECPRCHAVLAPFMPFCTNCKDGDGAVKRVYPAQPEDDFKHQHPVQDVYIDDDGRQRFVEDDNLVVSEETELWPHVELKELCEKYGWSIVEQGGDLVLKLVPNT